MIELITLDDPTAMDPRVVGAKAAGLSRLRTAGITVPDGVVLPVGVAAAVEQPGHGDSLRDAVRRACSLLDERVAVRSSATWEDGELSAHAGASTTILDVRGEDAVLEAVGTCLAGTAQAQRSLGAGGDTAVLIQSLVPADWAGVAFTADPVTGEREVVRLAATPGLGEALVQGDVVGIDVSVRNGVVDGDLESFPVDHALAVAEVARAIEALDQRPQDVEWAVLAGEVHVLQARPITVLPAEPTRPAGNNWQKDVAHYPEPLTPFGWSIFQHTAGAVHAVFDEMGLLIRGVEECSVGGEIYSRVLPALGSPDAAGTPPPAFVLGLAARVVPELRRRNARARRVLQEGTVETWVDQWHRVDRAEMQRRFAELDAVDLTRLDDAALVAHRDRCLEFAARGMQIHFRLMMPLFHALHRLHLLVGDELGWEDAVTSGLLAGHSPATRAADEAMDGLRAWVSTTEGAVDALDATPARPVEALRPVDRELAEAVQQWMDVHGWAMVNYDAGVPVLAERPTMITRLLRTSPEPISFDAADELADRARTAMRPERRPDFEPALADARALYPLREDNMIIVGDRPFALLRRWMLEVADRLLDRRVLPSPTEATYLDLDELRDALLGGVGGGGGGWAERIRLRRGEEAWVRAHPGPAYLGEQAPPPDTSRLPLPLRRLNEPILWAVGHEYPSPVDVPEDPSVLLAGVAASPGVVEGPVRVIRSQADLDRLLEGEVLVCQVTSPAWAPLFPLAAAVVADGGGVLSHAAIASREHGIPAVLGTGGGTRDLKDGQLVRVDGTRGLVLDAS